MRSVEERHTVETGVVGLDESLLDLSILDEKNVTLAAVVAEDGFAVEAEVEGLGELAGGVTEEANLLKYNISTVAAIKCTENRSEKKSKKPTPLLPVGSRESAQALVLYDSFLSTNVPTKLSPCKSRFIAYTKGSLTEMTKAWPASLSLGWLMKPGTWVLEHAGP